jgi:DNA-binding transcriptional ArsR family regulator
VSGDGEDERLKSTAICLDATSLRGLAHPLRIQILDLLRFDGPATSTTLADKLGVTSGTTSWHLKKLAEHGLIEELDGRGYGRERWWQSASRGVAIDSAAFMENPAMAGDTQVFIEADVTQAMLRVVKFVHEDWEHDWRRAFILNVVDDLVLDAEALARLRNDIWNVLDRYLRHPSSSDGAERVVFQMQGFPYRAGQVSPPPSLTAKDGRDGNGVGGETVA